MDWAEMLRLIGRMEAAMGDLSTGELEALAIKASEIRQQAWTIRAQKIAIEVARES